MKLEIISKKKNPIFNREEIEFKVLDSDATPSRADVRKLLLSSTKTKKENLLVLKKINSAFGERESKGYAYIYENEKSLEKLEPLFIRKRNQEKEEKRSKSEEKPAESQEQKAEESAEAKSKEKIEEKEPQKESKEEPGVKSPESKTKNEKEESK